MFKNNKTVVIVRSLNVSFFSYRFEDKKVEIIQSSTPVIIPYKNKQLCDNIWIEMLKYFVVAMMCLVWLGICIFVTEDF